MWPMLLDMSRDECKRILRRLELEAYASVITAFRAQGALTKEKKNLLKDIAHELNISMERHRAEVRRAVNDEKLATIAEHMAGPDTGTEWAIVGRRLVPLMPRLVPQTAFTVLANNVANLTAAGNARLPVPAATAKLPGSGPESSTWEPSLVEGSKAPGCPAHLPNSSHATEQSIGPSSFSKDFPATVPDVQIKRELEEEVEEESSSKGGNKRMRTHSYNEGDAPFCTSLSQTRPVSSIASTLSSSKILGASMVPTSTSQSAVGTSSTSTSTASRMVTVSTSPVPVKITVTSTTAWSTSATTTTSSGSAQKVIIVSSSGSCGSPSILHRSLSVPMVKTVSSSQSSSSAVSSVSSSGSTSISSALSRGPTSYIINSSGGQVSSQSGTVVTISTSSSNENSGGSSNRNLDGSSASASSSTVSILGSASSGSGSSIPSTNMIHKLRPKPQSVSIGSISRPRTGPIVIPVTPNTHHPLHQTLTCAGTPTAVQQQKPKSLLGVHTVKQEVTGCTVSALGKSQGGMKILPISGMASSGSSMAKILPKPAKGSNLYVVNANNPTTTVASQMSVVSRVVPTSVLSPTSNLSLSTSSVSVLGTRTVTTGSGNRINLNATAVARCVNSPTLLPVSSGPSAQHSGNSGTAVLVHQAGRTMTTTSVPSSSSPATSISSSSAVSLSSPLSTVSAIGSGSGKSNVIVVQKGPSGNTTFCRGVSLGTTTKELVGKVLKGKAINPSSMTAITVQRRPANTPTPTVSVCNSTANSKNGSNLNISSSSSQGNVIVLDLSNEQLGSNTILNELLQGSGIYTEAINSNSSSEESVKMVDSTGISPLPDSTEDTQVNTVVESSIPSVLTVPQTRVVTYEEAVELLGASVGENGQIFMGKKTNTAGSCKAILPSASTKLTDLEGLEDVEEVPPVEAEVMEGGKAMMEDGLSREKISNVLETVDEECSSTVKMENKPMDIFSTAIASADINLDSIQFLDEETDAEVGGYAVTIEPAPFDHGEIQNEEEIN